MTTTSSFGARADRLVDRVKKNPEGLLLVAAGCALLLRAGSTPRSGDPIPRSNPASKVGSQAAEYVQAATETASDYASQAASYATSTAEDLKAESERFVGNVRTTIESVSQRQPLAIAAAGLLAGAAIATVFPRMGIERRTMEPLAEGLREAGAELADRLSQGAQAASDRLKQAANERGLNAEGAKEVGAELAQAFTGPLSDEGPAKDKYENAAPGTPGKTSI